MPQSVKFCKIFMYADDVRLCIEVGVINAYVKMSVDMKRIVHWAHLMAIKSKCKEIWYSTCMLGLPILLHSNVL